MNLSLLAALFAVFVVLPILIYFLFKPRSGVELGGIVSEEHTVGQENNSIIAKQLVLFFSILAGMITVAVYKRLKQGQDFNSIYIDFFVAAILSPIIVKGVIGDITNGSQYFSIFLQGYQTGFTWDAMVGALRNI